MPFFGWGTKSFLIFAGGQKCGRNKRDKGGGEKSVEGSQHSNYGGKVEECHSCLVVSESQQFHQHNQHHPHNGLLINDHLQQIQVDMN